ncbi:sulfotransferase family 2 domain-containing protein [Jiella sonneratiae]|uniref:Sulfotransferase family 2 domain-containing protein n=1 Tax=Jiella sonneratiae TaxID=2816856 RepID=A0ABS3J843_9HYPH|nr:sulfotransferase family 2 domain-containing protein [Jiella sonneratiae]MBO0905832.1 sulfotransferase family 2 domain-containing protein [Jiella sonneratiae]
MTRNAIIVVGMHRSGTSALAGALRFAGLQHSPDLMPAAADNPDGFFEPLPVVRMNERMLNLAGAAWNKVPFWMHWANFARADFGRWCAETFAETAEKVWHDTFQALEGDVVCKDPRLALTLPVWLKAAEANGFAPKVLLVHRPSIAIMASLARRNRMEFEGAADLVADYWEAMLHHAPADARVVGYDAFREDPAATLETLGLPVAAPEQREELRRYVRKDDSRAPTGAIPPAFMPDFLRECDRLLPAAHGATLPPEPVALAKRFGQLRRAQKLYRGDSYLLPEPRPTPGFNVAQRRGRKVVLHCHIFKNAGSSVDVLLRSNFGKRWKETEFPARAGFSNADLTNTFVRTFNGLDAVSTHTGDCWLGHNDAAVTVLPIVFLRHPILRIRSAYSFERKQVADTLGAKLAKENSFSDYVRARLDRSNDYAFRDFQARRIASFHARVCTDLRSAAFTALDSLPFVGLVEDFDASCRRMEDYLKPHFPKFSAFTTRANVTDASDRSVADKLQQVMGEMDEDVAARLLADNTVDLAIYEAVTQRVAGNEGGDVAIEETVAGPATE